MTNKEVFTGLAFVALIFIVIEPAVRVLDELRREHGCPTLCSQSEVEAAKRVAKFDELVEQAKVLRNQSGSTTMVSELPVERSREPGPGSK